MSLRAVTFDLSDTLAELRVSSNRMVLYPDALPCLQALRRKGLAVGVVSNWGKTLPRVLEALGLEPYVEVAIAAHELGFAKPDPRPFEAALRALGVDPQEALHVGDSLESDVVGAERAGMRALHLVRSGSPAPGRILSLEELVEELD